MSDQNISHVIIEGRDRHGGRIAPSTLDGEKIELGAAFVHKAGITNRIAQIVSHLGWGVTEINVGTS